MSKDTRDEALDTIQVVADFLPTEYDLPEEVCEYLRIVEALARHRDNPNCLDAKDTERLAKISRTNG
jgi:hypothetical protein